MDVAGLTKKPLNFIVVVTLAVTRAIRRLLTSSLLIFFRPLRGQLVSLIFVAALVGTCIRLAKLLFHMIE